MLKPTPIDSEKSQSRKGEDVNIKYIVDDVIKEEDTDDNYYEEQ